MDTMIIDEMPSLCAPVRKVGRPGRKRKHFSVSILETELSTLNQTTKHSTSPGIGFIFVYPPGASLGSGWERVNSQTWLLVLTRGHQTNCLKLIKRAISYRLRLKKRPGDQNIALHLGITTTAMH